MKKILFFLMLTLLCIPWATQAQSITVSPSAINAGAEGYNNTLAVTYGGDVSNYQPNIQFYDTDGITPVYSGAYSWLSAYFYQGELQCGFGANPGIVRTAYFRVVLEDPNNNYNAVAYSNLVTISQAANDCPAPDHLALTEGGITTKGGSFTWTGYTDEYWMYIELLDGMYNELQSDNDPNGRIITANFDANIPQTLYNNGQYIGYFGNNGFTWSEDGGVITYTNPNPGCIKTYSHQAGTTSKLELYMTQKNYPTIISFEAMLSAGGNNNASFWIDGIKVLEITGGEFQTKDWSQYSFELSAYNSHTLKWEYTKNDDTQYGDDALFLDDIIVYKYSVDYSYDPVRCTSNSATLNDLGGGYTYRVFVKGVCPQVYNEQYGYYYSPETGPSDAVVFTTAINCQVPDHLTATNVAGTSADIRWAGYGYDHFDIFRANVDLSSIDSNRVNGTSSTFSGLSPNTTYKVWLKTTCETGMRGPATRGIITITSDTLVFTTSCGVLLPYFEDFENCGANNTQNSPYSALPECWNRYNETTYNFYKGYPTVQTTGYNNNGYSYSGNQHLCMNSRYYYTENNTDLYAILPVMGTVAVNTLQLSFYACHGHDNYNNIPLYVGVMTDPDDISTFEPVDTIGITGVNTSVWGNEYDGYQYYGYNQYEVDFSSYTGEGKHIAFMMEPATSSEVTKIIYIDDINCVSTAAPSSSCDITFDLVDSYGDGWNGNTIEVRDASTGELLATMKNEDLDGDYQSANEHNVIPLSVNNGQEIVFLWVYDAQNRCCPGECSWVITGPNGDVISEVAEGDASNYENGKVLATYTVNCSTTPTPPTPPTCEAPVLTVDEVTATYAHITWTGDAQNTTWQFVTDDYDDSYPNERNENYLSLGGLVPETEYIVRVRAICNGTDTSAWSRTTFTTLRAPAVSDSWSDDFNSQYPNWTLEIYGQNTTNKWMLGTAASNDGSKCLYISNDYSTYAYTNTAASTVYAYKFLYFENDQYNFEYDWKCAGESTNDYFKVFLAPKYAYIYGGYLNYGLSYNTVPNNWIAVGTYHSGENTWQRESVNVEVPAGNYMVVILWHNNDSDGSNPPAAIDNFSITRGARCLPITNLHVIDMDPDAAQITWTHGGNETLWDLYWTTSDVAPVDTTTPTVGRTPNDQPWLAPLTPNTHYYAYVRARCSDENRSQWSPAVEFTTPSPYTITFNAGNGGTATVGSLECGGYLDLSNVSATPTTYCQNDWTFIGWSETPVSETTNAPTLVGSNYYPSGNTTLYAVYQQGATYNSNPVCAAPSFTITYLDDNNILDVDTFEVGATITPIADPTKEGYTFTGWTPALPAIMPDYDFRVIAQWQVNKYNITINQMTGGTITVGVVDNYGNAFSATTDTSATYNAWVNLSVETDAGYTFGNYVVTTASGIPIEIINSGFVMPAENVTISANFESEKHILTINYIYSTSGNNIYPSYKDTLEYGESYSVVSPPENDGFYPSIDTVSGVMGAEDITINVSYLPRVYNVTLHPRGGTLLNGFTSDTSYTRAQVFWLPTANDIVRDGYSFGGWYRDTTFVGNPYRAIPNVSTGDWDLYAKWDLLPCLAPENLAVASGSLTATSALITWNSNQNNAFGGFYYENGVLAGSNNQLYQRWNLSELQPNSNYRVGVFAYCSLDRVSDTVWVEFTTNDTCYPPVSVSISDVTAHSALLSYDFGEHVPHDYIVHTSLTPDFNIHGTLSTMPEYFPNAITIRYYLNAPLQPNTTYYVRLSSLCDPNSNLTSVWSETLSFTTLQEYAVTIDANITNGTVTVSDTAAIAGAVVNLTATPNHGYSFGEWVVTTVNTPAPETVTVTNNSFVMPEGGVNVSATFIPNKYVLTYKNGNNIQYQDSVAYGTAIRPITDPTREGYTFIGWVPELPATMPAYDVTVHAQWQINRYQLTINYFYFENGTVQAAPSYTDTLEYGESYSVVSPTVQGFNPTIGTVSGVMGTDDITVRVDYIPQVYQVTLHTMGGTLLNGFTSDTIHRYTEVLYLPTANDIVREGYSFGGWFRDTNFVGNPVIAIPNIAPGDWDLYAKWDINSYTVTANVNPANAGTVTGAGTYNYGNEVEMRAEAAEGYLFTNWTNNQGEVVSTNAIFDFEIANDTAFTANFTAMGVVATPTFSPAGGTYHDYDNVNVTLECATSGATIYYTTDGSTPTASSTTYNGPISLTENTTIKAIAMKEGMINSEMTTATYVVLPTYAITTANNIANGTVRADASRAAEGETVNLTAIANNGYHLSTWAVTTATGTVEVSANNSFVMPAGNVTISATFEPNGHTITYYNVSGEIMTVDTFAYGDTITPIADPSLVGYTFTGWYPALPTTMPDYDLNTMAHWQINRYRININQVQGGIVQAIEVDYSTGDTIVIDSADYGSRVQIFAITNDGCTYNDVVVTDANGTVLSFSSNGFTMPASDVTVTPRFTIQKFTITYRDDGDTLAVDTFAYGANITPIADPTKEGYTFIGWSIELPSTMPANNLLVGALWQKNSYKVTVTQVTGGTISIYYYDETGHENNITTGDSIYYGAWIYFRRVVTDNGYNFNSYVVTNADGSPIATPNNSHFVMPANDVTVTANFDVRSYELTINYLYQNGTEAAPSHTETIEYNTSYSVVSPAVTGYTASQDTVMGIMGAGNSIVNVIYSISSYNITINQVTGGTVSVLVEGAPAGTTSNTTANYNAWVQLSGQLDTGYSLYGFTVTNADGTPVIITPTNSFTMPANDVTVSANFIANEYTITYYMMIGSDIIWEVDTFLYGDIITPVAHPTREGYTFTGWEHDIPTTMPDHNIAVGAQWQVNSYNITIDQVAGGTITVIESNTGVYSTTTNTTATFGSWIQLVVATNNGYTFNDFVVTNADGTPIEITNDGFIMPANDVTVTANFTANEYTITYLKDNEVLAVDTFACGDTIIPIADPTTVGLTFIGWHPALPITMPAYDVRATAQWQFNKYRINIDQVQGGSVQATQVIDYSTSETIVIDSAEYASWVQLSAVANEGYTFYGIVVTDTGGTVLSITNNGFAMPASDVTVTATFTINSYTVTTTINPENAGTISGAGTYNYGTEVTLTATPATGYSFDYWQNMNITTYSATETANPLTFTLTGDVEYKAFFTLNNYTITYKDGNTVLGVDTFAYGATITPMADPTKEGYTFTGWDTELPTTMPANDLNRVAQWQINSYRINIDQVQGGNVQATNGTIVIDSAAYGSLVQLSIVTNEGCIFNNLVVTDANGTPLSVTNNSFYMPASDVTITPSFTIRNYTITYIDRDNVLEVDTFACGSTIIPMVDPTREGYTFIGWDPALPTNMPAHNMAVAAIWQVNNYNVTVTQVTGGTITIGYIDSTSTTMLYSTTGDTVNYGAHIYLYAVPDTGYSFNNYVVTNVDGSPIAITNNKFIMPANDVNVSASFAVKSYELTINYLYQNGTEAAPSHTDTIEYNSAYSVVSPALTGYTASQDTVMGTMGAMNLVVNVTYSINSYNITVNQVTGGTISLSMEGAPAGITSNTTANYNTIVQLYVIPDNGYSFNEFTVTNADGTPVIITPTNSFTMPANDVTVSANFSVNNYTITYQDGNGNVIDVDTLAFGANITPIANPTREGYTFMGWSHDLPTTMPAYNILVDAQWQINSYNITVNQVEGGTITVRVNNAGANGTTTNTTAEFNSRIQLTVATDNGYTFNNFVVTNADGTPIETPNNGFYMPANDVTVTANISVNNYTITYQDGNGNVIEVDTLAFGANITPIANPTLEGYTFTGWDPAIPATMPAYDLIVYAQWQINSYNITINQVTGGTITVTVAGATAGTTTNTTADFESWIQLSEVTLDGYTFGDFVVTTADGTPIETPNNGFIMPASDVTVTANVSVNNYTITYMNGNIILAQDTVAFGATVTPIANPTKEGYTFTGWDPALPTTMPANDLTVNAQWQINSYNITINQVTGGTIVITIDNSPGIALSTTADYNSWINLDVVTFDGYTFNNFEVTNADGTPIAIPFNGFSMPANDVTVTANFSVNNYSITYMDGNSILAQDSVAFGATITPIANPTKEGYTFTGWDPALPTTMPANDLTVNAQWQINSYDITINQVTGGTITVSFAGESATSIISTTTDTSANFETWIQLSEVTEDGYTFVDYLVTDEDGEIIETTNNGFIMPAIDVTVTAIFSVNNYTITYMDGNSILAQDTVAFGATVTPIANPTKEGYTFTGWDPALPTTMPANDLTVNAQWQINSYNITINQVTGGTITATVAGATAGTTTNTTADYNSWINLDVVTSDGYTFNNFVVTNTDGTTIEIINNGFIMPANDVTVTATFSVNNYTITYMDGNSILAQDTVAFGATVTPIDNPTKEGYTFTGWDPELPTTMPANDLTVNAQWQVNIYRVNIDQNPGGYVMVIVEGSAVGTTIFDSTAYNTQVQLDVVTLDGYTFNGFTVVAADGTPVAITPTNSFTMPANDVTVSGSFSVNNYTITYMDGNIVLDVDTFAFGATVTPIANPTKEGYTFTGWDPALPTTMPANDVTVNAQWQVNSYDITINQVTGGTITVTVTGATAGTTTNTTANFGSWVQMSVNADYGYDFVDFLVISASGDTLLTPNYSFMMPAENVTITAVFTLHNFNITVNVSDDTPWGTVTGSGSFAYGSTDTLTATPMDEHHIFVGWSDFNTENPRVITVTQDSTLTAYFVPEDIDIISNDTLMGGVNVQIPGGGHLTPNTPIVITATPAPHYHFVSWSDGNTDNPRTIYPMQAIGLTAIFAIDQHTITVLSNDGTMGEVDGDGTFDYGSEIQISATAFSGYVFVSWNDGNTENPRTITVEQDSSFTAIFQLGDGVDDVELPNVLIYAHGNQIVVSNAEGYTLEIYDMSGRLIASESKLTQSVSRFNMSADGVYLVKIGNSLFRKVVVTR